MDGPAVCQLDETASTQDVLHEMAAAGAVTGSAVVARAQTGGRGRRGRSWTSPPGGLWLSVLCRPPADGALDVLSLRVGLAVSGALEAACPGTRLALKWPNDLVLTDRKVGGILCEARWQGGAPGWVAVGLGLNVCNAIPEDLAAVAIALAAVAPDATPGGLQEGLLGAIRHAGGQGGPLRPAELADWAARDWLAGRRLAAPVAGRAAGLSADGALQVTTDDGATELVRAGTVELEAGAPGASQGGVIRP